MTTADTKARAQGLTLMIAAGLVFTAMVSMVKLLRDDMAAVDVIFWRGLLAVPLAWLVLRSQSQSLAIPSPALLALRCSCGFLAMFGFFQAAHALTIVDLTLVSKLQPVMVALFAPLVLGRHERSGWRVWAALAACCVGVYLLLDAQVDIARTAAIWALMAAAASAVAHVCVRGLSRPPASMDGAALVLYFQMFVFVASFAWTLSDDQTIAVPTLQQLPALVGIALAATGGQLLMTAAYRRAPAAVIATASYTTPIWGLTADVIVFGNWPSGLALLGGGIIIAAGLSMLPGERPRPRG